MTPENSQNKELKQYSDSALGIDADDTSIDYIQAINEIKNNSVDRSKYDQLRAENRRLIDSIVNGQSLDNVEVKEQKQTAEELREQLFGNSENLSNLEYISLALKLRNAELENGRDIFVGSGHKLTPSAEDYATAERVASVLQECVDYADGNSEVFTNELLRRTTDVALPRKR